MRGSYNGSVSVPSGPIAEIDGRHRRYRVSPIIGMSLGRRLGLLPSQAGGWLWPESAPWLLFPIVAES